MAELDILSLTPHKVSRNLRGYSVLFYGEPKSGKTTTATLFPHHLILAFEKGYSAIPGAMAAPMNSWSDFKKILRQLKETAAMEKYETIIIDTADIAWDYAEKFVCSNAGVTSIGDVPFGKGYATLAKEYDEALRLIVQLGYGLVLISHSTDKTFTDAQGKEFNKIVPTLNKRPENIVSRLCDIIAYARPVQDPETKEIQTRLFLRGTERFTAGSRFKYTPDSIIFTYANLVGAINESIDKQMEEVGSELFTDNRENLYAEKTITVDFDTLVSEFNTLIKGLTTEYTEEQFDTFWAPRIIQLTENNLGKGNRVAECTRDQVEVVDLVVADLKDLIKKGMPEVKSDSVES